MWFTLADRLVNPIDFTYNSQTAPPPHSSPVLNMNYLI